jgi:hypothetical protein
LFHCLEILNSVLFLVLADMPSRVDELGGDIRHATTAKVPTFTVNTYKQFHFWSHFLVLLLLIFVLELLSHKSHMLVSGTAIWWYFQVLAPYCDSENYHSISDRLICTIMLYLDVLTAFHFITLQFLGQTNKALVWAHLRCLSNKIPYWITPLENWHYTLSCFKMKTKGEDFIISPVLLVWVELQVAFPFLNGILKRLRAVANIGMIYEVPLWKRIRILWVRGWRIAPRQPRKQQPLTDFVDVGGCVILPN